MARQLQVAIDCRDPDRLAAFWREVLEYRLQRPPAGEEWAVVEDPLGVGPSVLFHRVPEAKITKNRVHLDIRVAPGADKATARPFVDAEVRRLIALGATHMRTDDDESDYYAVMQDPEGNEFCIG
jgi:catechol 2,3-dioxygenase-like lactoylglutathione lyase family enzyme